MSPHISHLDLTREFSTPEGCFIHETWNSNHDPAVSVARARLEPGLTTQIHFLKGIHERYLITEGYGEVQLAGEPSIKVVPGDLVFIPAGTSQTITNTGATDLVFYCICTPRFSVDVYVNLEDGG